MGYQFVFEISKCIGCGACEMACAKKNNFFYGYRQLARYQRPQIKHNLPFFLSLSCHHCSNPECMKTCPEGLYNRTEQGIILHQEGECKGCTKCVQACPYKGPQYNTAIGKVKKCNFCHELLEDGLSPRCIAACPTGALTFRFQGEKNREVENGKNLWQEYLLEKGYITQPNIKIIVPEVE